METLYAWFDGYERLKSLIDTSDEEVLLRLGKPTLIKIPGTDAEPRARFVSCLLHGNEDSGYRAVLNLLRTGARFPFDLWIFIGNVPAASRDGWFAHRYLDDQEDFNRVWRRGGPSTSTSQIADAVLATLDALNLEASLDLHNNSGENPYFAVLSQKSDASLALAAACVDIILEWPLRSHLLMEVLSSRCPSILVECGLAGNEDGTAFAIGVLHRFLNASPFERSAASDAALLVTTHRVAVRPEVTFTFANELVDGLDLALRPGLDTRNFGALLAGTELGYVHPGAPMPLHAIDMSGNNTSERLFTIRSDGRLTLAEDIIPVMMARTELQVRRDCLFYSARRCRY